MDDTMFAASNLEGLTINNWYIKEKLPKADRSKGESGGNFSICYIVNKDGKDFFMKVLNYQNIISNSIPMGVSRSEYMEIALKEFNYEKNLSKYCRDKKISKVVIYEDCGEIELSDYVFPTVSYIIYEMATGNIRKYIEYSKKLDFSAKIKTLSDKLQSLRDVATGLKNLHYHDITHQDLKPSNVMTFENESKIGDLGRSLCFDDTIECPYSAESFHGDWNYAPPEAIFNYLIPDLKERLYQMDNYTLGGLMSYYLAGMSFNALLELSLPMTMRDMRRSGFVYENVKMDLINAYTKALDELRKEIPLESVREDMVKIIGYLCNPDPARRGHPKNILLTNCTSNYDLQRTISELDLALKRANIELLKY